MAKNKSAVQASKSSFDPQTLAATGSEASALVNREGEKGVDLVEAWVRERNADAVLAIANDEAAPVPVRKAAKRGLQVLKSRGVTIPERTHVARLTSIETPILEAWLMSPEASGSMLVVLGSHTPTSRYRLAQFVIQPTVGVLQVQPMEISGSQLRTWMEDLERRFAHGPVPVSVEWARSRIAEARADQAKSGLIPPMGIDLQKDLLEPVPEQAPPHPIDAANLELPDASTVVPSSAMLHGDPEFRAWVPPPAAIQALVSVIGQELGRHGTPEAPPEEEKFEAIMAGALDDLTDRFFSPEIRQQLALVMKDAAISVLARAGRERAARVMAVANAVVSAGLVTSPPHEVPFLRAFFQKAIALLAAQNGGRISIPVQVPVPAAGQADAGATAEATEAAEPSPIVTPAEAAAEKAAPGEQVSPGGIILP